MVFKGVFNIRGKGFILDGLQMFAAIVPFNHSIVSNTRKVEPCLESALGWFPLDIFLLK